MVGIAEEGVDGLDLDRVADRCAGAVAFEECDAVDRHARLFVRPLQRQALPAGLGAGHAAVAVRRHPPAEELRVDGAPLGDGVFRAHQHDEAAALAGEEAVGFPVVHPHPFFREGRTFCKADQLERIEAEIDAAGQGDVEVTVEQGVAGVDHRQERGGAGAVDGVAAAVEAEVVADAAGDGVRQASGERVLADGGERLVERLLETLQRLAVDARFERGAPDVGPAQAQRRGARAVAGERVADDDAGARLRRREAGVLQGQVGHFEGQPVREVGRLEGAARDAVPGAVERPVRDHGRVLRVRAVGHVGIGRVVVVERQPLARDPAEGLPLGEHVLPQLARRRGVGIAAGRADDGDGTG
jgi:hypothetical protein